MLTEVAQRGLLGQLPLNQIGRNARNDDLTAMGDRQQARDAVDRRAEIVAVALVRIAGMQGHADGQALDRIPLLGVERPLRLERGRDRCRPRRERDAKGVADGLEDETAAALERFP